MMNFLFLVAHAVTISTAIPGTNANSTSSSPGAFIANFYQFALMIGGILAFGAIVFGGVKYMASAGNPSAQSDGKEWIWGALIGLLLLAGAYLILDVINPQLVNLNLPTLNGIQAINTTSDSAPSGPGACGSGNANSNCTCPSGQTPQAEQVNEGSTETTDYICGTGNSQAQNPNYTCSGTTSGTCPTGQTCQSTNWTGADGVVTKLYYCG